jgi:hypothetical protein
VNTNTDFKILKQYYTQHQIVRLPLDSIDRLVPKISNTAAIWVDPCIDGYEHRLTTKWAKDPRADWSQYYKALWNNLEKLFAPFPHYHLLTNPNNWRKTQQANLDRFITSVLDKCASYDPMWISVPQLPLVDKGSRNKINTMLAEAAGKWKKKTSWAGHLVLPVIVTNQKQLSTPTIQREKLRTIVNSFENSEAQGLWIVDVSLSDQQRNARYPIRYQRLIEFHEMIRQRFGAGVNIIAGPYWGINLVLWVRGLCDTIAISLSGSSTYNISCGVPSSPVNRIVLPPLRRLVVLDNEATLREWLKDTLSRLSPQDSAHSEFQEILTQLPQLQTREMGLRQIARFYSFWLESIGSISKRGRKLALYQELSSAYVIGSQLKDLPEATLPNASKAMRKAGKVAEQLMLKCLS